MEFLNLTEFGIVFVTAISLLIWAALLYKIKGARTRHGLIASLALSIFLGFFIIGPFVAAVVQPFLAVPLTEKGTDIEVATEEGTIKISVVDALSGSSITSGKVYLLKGSYDISVLDKIKKGDLKAGTDYLVMTLGASGSVEFPGQIGSPLGITYTAIYEPGSLSSTGYPIAASKVVAYRALDTGYLKVTGGTLSLYCNSPVAIFDPTGTAKTGYVMSTLSFDLSARIGPTTANKAAQRVWIYTNRSTDKMAELQIWVNDVEVTFRKLSDLDASDPRVKNAPAGATYVSDSLVIADVLPYDQKVTIRIKGTASDNNSLLLTFIQNADIEYGDVSLGTFKIVINTSGSAGWLSS